LLSVTATPATTTASRRIEYMPLDEIPAAWRNPRVHDLPALRRAITRFGFTNPPILDERTGRLVAGHGRRLVLAEMRDADEYPPEGVSLADDGQWLVPVVRGWASASDSEAEAVLIGDNRLGELAAWDDRALTEMLDELLDQHMIEPAGFTADDLDELLRSTGALGDAAAGFLDPAAGGQDAGGAGQDDHDGEAAEGETAVGDYVQVSWLVDVEDRDTIRTAIKTAQDRWQIDVAAQALAALCRHFIEQGQQAA
jgi:hypothetical protein